MQPLSSKPRVISSYEKVSLAIQEQIKLQYPYGYSQHLITFKNKEGDLIKGLRFEAEDKIYLIKMTVIQAKAIIEEDDDYDEEGNLLISKKDKYEDKYNDFEYDGSEEEE